MDVRTKKCVFLQPGGGEKLFDPRASRRKGQECQREIRTKKFMFMLFFSPLNYGPKPSANQANVFHKDFSFRHGNATVGVWPASRWQHVVRIDRDIPSEQKNLT